MDIKEREEDRGVSKNGKKVEGECSLLNTLCFSFLSSVVNPLHIY